MTCVIAAKCSDGIIIASDTKVTDEFDIYYENKIVQHSNLDLVYASSGPTGLIDSFYEDVQIELNKKDNKGKSKIKDWKDFKLALESKVHNVNRRYYAMDGESAIEVFVGFKTDINQTGLLHLRPSGVGENVRGFDIIGSGKPYALPFIKSLYYHGISLESMTVIVSFTLALLDELEVHSSVGGVPQIVWIKDQQEADEETLFQLDGAFVSLIIKRLMNERANLSTKLNCLLEQAEITDKKE